MGRGVWGDRCLDAPLRKSRKRGLRVAHAHILNEIHARHTYSMNGIDHLLLSRTTLAAKAPINVEVDALPIVPHKF